jgi:hypothetical protein
MGITKKSLIDQIRKIIFSKTINLIEQKLSMILHWVVFYRDIFYTSLSDPASLAFLRSFIDGQKCTGLERSNN